MKKDKHNYLGFGLSVAALIAAGSVFSKRLSTVERKGIGIASSVLLVVAAVTLLSRFENTVEEAKELIA